MNFERYPLREIPMPEATNVLYDKFVGLLEEKIEAGCDRNLVCREACRALYTGQSGLEQLTPETPTHPWSGNLLHAHFDPRNITLEAERYGDCDHELYAPRKPLIWLWYLFDRSPLGMNIDLGFRVRRLLARYVIRDCGANFKCFPFVELAFGYNLSVGDGVVIHRWVNLDDRKRIIIGNRTSLSDFVNIYSHTHDINEQELVANVPTVLEDDVRITYHATILAGSHVKRGSMIGAGALLTSKVVPAGEIWIGLPAKKARDKDYFVEPNSGERWSVEQLREWRAAQNEEYVWGH